MCRQLIRWCLLHFLHADQLCAFRRHHHHPGTEAAIPRHWRKRVQHLPVSLALPWKQHAMHVYANRGAGADAAL